MKGRRSTQGTIPKSEFRKGKIFFLILEKNLILRRRKDEQDERTSKIEVSRLHKLVCILYYFLFPPPCCRELGIGLGDSVFLDWLWSNKEI